MVKSSCIDTLSVGLVIDSFTSRPFAKQWSLISLSHQGPLLWNDHWFPSFNQGPLQSNGHWFLCHIKALSFGMIIDFLSLHHGPLRDNGHWFLMFTSRPFTRQWSSISLHQDHLVCNGHWFLSLHQGPLQTMVIDFFVTSRPSPMEW